MKLSVTALTITLALVWGIAVLLVGLFNLKWPGYGNEFLQVIASIYPGYKHSGTLVDVLVGMGYAIVDGAFCGFILAVIYNALVCTEKKPA